MVYFGGVGLKQIMVFQFFCIVICVIAFFRAPILPKVRIHAQILPKHVELCLEILPVIGVLSFVLAQSPIL